MKRNEGKKQYLDAIKKGEFKAYMQKVVDVQSLQVVGGELLARWDKPEKGVVCPAEFIEQMIMTDTIAELDYYMFEEACKQQQEWQASGKNMFLSCNFTRLTLSKPDFVEKVFHIIKKYDFDHSKVVIEITEDCVESNGFIAFFNIAKCKELGLMVVIDDFGAGNTSFDDFKHYPVDIVKIDRSLLLEAEKEEGRKTLHSLISRISNLGVKVLCEGIETEEQAEMLKSFGCDYLQGFYFGRPESRENL